MNRRRKKPNSNTKFTWIFILKYFMKERNDLNVVYVKQKRDKKVI